MSLRLSGWRSLTESELWQVPDGPGVYEVRCPGPPIPRALAKDHEMILDIGESKNLQTRLLGFLRCALGRSKTGHMAGWRFAHLSRRLSFRRRFPVRNLEFRWRERRTKKAANDAECARMQRYLRRFGELPPLNYKFNWADWVE